MGCGWSVGLVERMDSPFQLENRKMAYLHVWIKLQGLLAIFWSIKVFIAIGDSSRVFLEVA